MDRATFDALTRRVAQHATRRAALAALLGGALLLGGSTASDATDRARRRKRKKRNQRDNDHDKTGSGLFKRGISVVIDNTQGNHPIIVEAGEVIHQTRCCNGLAAWNTIPVGESRLFDTSSDQAYVWIDNAYWIEFFNPFVGFPWVSAARDGMVDGKPNCCKPGGTTVVKEKDLAEGESMGFALNIQEFFVRRNDDKPDFKFFTLEVR